jgi:hypothetical protein
MARLNLFPLSLGLAASIVGATFFVGSWAVKNQVDHIAQTLWIDQGVAPSGLPAVEEGLFRRTVPFSPDETKARALWPVPPGGRDGVLLPRGEETPRVSVAFQRIALLRKHLEVHPHDVAAHAHVVRLAFLHPPIRLEADEGPIAIQNMTPEWEAALASAAEGQELDPSNAFFPLLESAILFGTGDREGGLAALRRAGHAERYEEYVLDEADTIIAVLERHLGYRGERVRVTVEAGFLLPHLTGVRSLLLALHDLEEPARRTAYIDLLRVSKLMFKGSDTAIGMFEATNFAMALADGSRTFNVRPRSEWPAMIPQARELDERLALEEPLAERLVEVGVVLREVRFGRNLRELDMMDFQFGAVPYIVSARLLLSLVACGIFGLIKAALPARRRSGGGSALITAIQAVFLLAASLLAGSLTAPWYPTAAGLLVLVGLGLWAFGRLQPLSWNTYGFVLVLLAAGYAVATAAVIRDDRIWGELGRHLRTEADQLRFEVGMRRAPF